MEPRQNPNDRQRAEKPPGGAPCTVRWILFDFGGVLAEEGFLNGLRHLARDQGLDPEAVTEAGIELVFRTGYALGKGHPEDFWRALREETGLSGREEELSETMLSGFTLRPWMLDIVRSLRHQGLSCGLLSDQTDWLDRLNRRFGFFRAFDRVFNSFHTGKSKREPSLFNEVAAELATEPEAILLIDDSQGNVGRAAAAGFQTILYTDRSAFLRELERFCPQHAYERP